MDPTTIAATLGSGSVQVVLATVVVGLCIVGWTLARALIESYRDRIDETKEALRQQSADARLIAEALRDMKSTIDLALAALKGGR